MALKLKLDDAGNVVLKDGKPVYIKDDNTEIAFDADHAFAKIGQLTGESTEHRKKRQEAETALTKFEGIEDVAAAKKAIDIVKNLDSKKLIDAGEVDKVRNEAIAATELKYKPYVDKSEKLEKQLTGEKIGGAFARSKVIAEKLTIPADLVQARFGDRFKVEEGKIVAYNEDGSKVYSQSRAGELADFDEALELIVDRYPQKASILKGTGASGGGAGGGTQGAGGGGNGGGSKQIILRSKFDAMSATDQQASAKLVSAGKAEIRDA